MVRIAWNKGKKFSEESRKKMSLAHIGKNMGEMNATKRPEVRLKISQSHKWRTYRKLTEEEKEHLRKINTGKKLSPEARMKVSLALKGRKKPARSLETRLKISKTLSGINSYRWKGGITKENHKIRTSLEYRLWRESVFKRDNYACVWCKNRCEKGNSVYLHADHVQKFSEYPELRFAIDNGRTLCSKCHKRRHKIENVK